MPFAGLGLHVVIAIYFAVHAMRTGQDKYWLFILFAFPLLGSLVYAFAIWLPDARRSPQGHMVVRGVRQLLDPTRELRERRKRSTSAPRRPTGLRLADALLGAGRASEAVGAVPGRCSAASTPTIRRCASTWRGRWSKRARRWRRA
jgi:hypothetical protein